MDLQEQRLMLEQTLYRLKVDDLKAIARDLKQRAIAVIRLTGLKSEFVERIIATIESLQKRESWDIVEMIVRIMNNRITAFHNLKMPIWVFRNNRVYSIRQLSAQQRTGLAAEVITPSSNPTKDVSYRPSPFYDIIERLAGPVDFIAPAKSIPQQKVLYFGLSQRHMDLLQSRGGPDDRHAYQVRFFCACHDGRQNGQRSDFQVEFPPVSDIKVNNQHIIPCERFRGRRNRPGVVSPPDLMCRPPHLLSQNHARINYLNKSEMSKFYVATIELVKRRTIESLITELKTNQSISKETVLQRYNDRIKEDDVVMESATISTRCPLSFNRIATPCRSLVCRHLQCFDAASFLLMNENIPPVWECPICSRHIHSLADLVIDEYFADILSSVAEGVEQVSVTSEGNIRIIKEDSSDDYDETKTHVKRSHSEEEEEDGLRVMILDDDDERTAPSDIPADHDKRRKTTPPSYTSQKASDANVIDLTVSSDEESEPLQTSQTTFPDTASSSTLSSHAMPYTVPNTPPVSDTTHPAQILPLFSNPSNTPSMPYYLPLMTPTMMNTPITEVEQVRPALPLFASRPLLPSSSAPFRPVVLAPHAPGPEPGPSLPSSDQVSVSESPPASNSVPISGPEPAYISSPNLTPAPEQTPRPEQELITEQDPVAEQDRAIVQAPVLAIGTAPIPGSAVPFDTEPSPDQASITEHAPELESAVAQEPALSLEIMLNTASYEGPEPAPLSTSTLSPVEQQEASLDSVCSAASSSIPALVQDPPSTHALEFSTTPPAQASPDTNDGDRLPLKETEADISTASPLVQDSQTDTTERHTASPSSTPHFIDV